MPDGSRIAKVREHALAWLVDKLVIGAGAVGGGVEGFLGWRHPISWADWWLRLLSAAAAATVVGFGFAALADRRRPLRLVFGVGGSFVEETDVEHGLMQFGVRRLYR